MKIIGKNVHLRNLLNNNFHFEMLAIDQRPPIFNIIERKKGKKASYKEIAEFKGISFIKLIEWILKDASTKK